jgi:cell division protein FtsB
LVALLLVVACGVIGYLYLSAARSLWRGLHEEAAVQGQVAHLKAEYNRLAKERTVLESRQYIETAARRLGFAFPGERQYVIGGSEG